MNENYEVAGAIPTFADCERLFADALDEARRVDGVGFAAALPVFEVQVHRAG